MGVWFFALLNMLAIGLFRMTGWNIGPEQPYSSPSPPSLAHIALGALFFLVLSSLWSGRQHVRQVWRKALRGDDSIDDSGELLPYRVAVFGFIASFSPRRVRALRHQHEPADRLCLSAIGPRDLRRLGAHHLAGRAGLLPRSGGPGRVHRQHPRIVVGRSPGSNGTGTQLPVVGRHPHLRHGLGRHGPQVSGSDAPRVPARILGHCRGHCRHPRRLQSPRSSTSRTPMGASTWAVGNSAI